MSFSELLAQAQEAEGKRDMIALERIMKSIEASHVKKGTKLTTQVV
jgi:hypothetical protein